MIIFILILAFGLRLMSLNQSLWLDEATSALTTRMNLSDFFGKFIPGDFHPPLYYLALRVWAGVFGIYEIALRSLSILFAIGTIYLVYLIGKEELINKETGLVASVLIATSGLHIYYSQEARMYTMSTFLVTLVVYFFLRLLRSYDTHEKKLQKGRVVWFLFALTLGLIFLTDYLPLLIIPVFFIFGIFSKKDFSWFKKLVMSHIILVVFVLLWFPTFIKQLTSGINVTTTSPSWVNILGKFSLKDILLIPVKFGIGRVGFHDKFTYAIAVGFIFLIFGFLFVKSLLLIKKIKLIYLWLIVPILISLVISIKIPVLNYFRFLFVLPAFSRLLFNCR